MDQVSKVNPLPLRVMLAFSPAEYERRFVDHYVAFYFRYAQASLVLGLFLVFGDFLVDYFAHPGVRANFLRLELCLPVLGSGLAYSFAPGARKHWQPVMAGFIVAMAFCLFWILLLIDSEGGAGLKTWVGILNFTFLEFYCFVILGVQFRYALASGVLILLAFEAAMWMHTGLSDAEVAYWSYHVVTLFILSAGIGWWREYLLRKEFSVRTSLDEARESAERLAKFLDAIVDGIPQPVFVKDSRHRWVLLNQRFCDMLGRDREALLGRSDPDVYPPEVAARAWAEDETAMAMQEPLFVQTSNPGPDGGENWVLESKQRVDLSDGAYLVGVVTDITPQKQTEFALRESEESHRLLAENSSDMILRITPQGALTYASPASLAAFGYPSGELVGRPVADFIHPDEREEAERLYVKVVRHNVANVVTCRLRRRDGTWTWAETSLRAVRDENTGHTVQVIGVSRNVEERVRVTAALNRFKYVLDNTLDMIYIFDEATLRYTYVNQGAVVGLGYPREKLLGMAPWELRPQMTEAEYRTTIEPFLSGEIRSRQFEAVLRRADGGELTADINMQLMRHPGESGIFISVMRDASERKRIDRMKNEFVSTVSHELRTPLTSIRGSLGLIAIGAAGELPEEARKLISIAYGNSERLVRLINDILDIEKIESGTMRFDLQPQHLRPLLEQAVEANRAYGEELGVCFEIAKPIPDRVILVDSDRFMQVMANLLSNAAKFSPSPGVVEVAAERAGEALRISVTDHGAGIPEDFRSKIFGKFSQADSADSRRKGGTGLGLSIVKTIVAKHGGTVGFDTQIGCGTTFHVTFPEVSEASLDSGTGRRTNEQRVPVFQGDPQARLVIATDQQEGDAGCGSAVNQERPAIAEPLRILYVEDQPDIRQVATLAFEAVGGFTVEACSSGEEALRALPRFRPDMILLDVMMPGMDGPSTLKQLRELPESQGVPAVFMTAKVQPHQIAELKAIGALDVIPKPFDPVTLSQTVSDIWAMHVARQAKPAPEPLKASVALPLNALEQIADAFAAALPSRLEEIATMCRALSAGEGGTELRANLHRSVHTLAGSAKTFGFPLVSDVARALELQLEPDAADAAVPDADQLSRIAGLLETLMRSAEQPRRPMQAPLTSARTVKITADLIAGGDSD